MSKLNSKKIIKAINKAIALNPSEITFNQITRNLVDGAYENVTTTKTLTVIIYTEDNLKSININSKTQGTSYTTNKYKMITDKDANLDVTPTQAIKFTSNGDKYEIKAVYPVIIDGVICGYECDLERID